MLQRDRVRAETQENAIISWGLASRVKIRRRRRLEEKSGIFGGLIFDFLHKIATICIPFMKHPAKMFLVVVHNAATVKNVI